MRDNQSDKIEKKKPNPENIALFGAIATVLTIINMSTGIEPPSQWVIILQYAALGWRPNRPRRGADHDGDGTEVTGVPIDRLIDACARVNTHLGMACD